MAEETPKFCTDFEGSSFTDICDAKSKIKHSKKYSLLSLDNFENNQRNKKVKIIKEYEEKKKNKKRHHSDLFKFDKCHIKNINEFIKKQKFKLRNDFDKKNSEKFLLSKEQVFENPFLEYNYI